MSEEFHIDAVDRQIVRALQRDASQSHATLAESVGASPASVWRRVRALERAGVLGASVRLADPAMLGRSVNVLCQVRMTRQTVDARAEFESFIQSREEIVECYAMSGEWDYLLRIAVRTSPITTASSARACWRIRASPMRRAISRCGR